MIIRITNKKEGLSNYLRVGKNNTRDTKDIREVVDGDIATFEKACEFSSKHKAWSANYKHITMSLSGNDQKIFESITEEQRNAWIKSISHEYLSLLFPHRNPEDLTTYIESHKPRQKYTEDGQRYYHWHIGVSLIDPLTGTRLSGCANVQRENAARQSHICSKFGGLDDPITYIDFEKTSRGKRVGVRKQVVDSLCEYFDENSPESYEELIDVIHQYSEASGVAVEIKQEGAGKIGHLTINAKRKSDGKKATIRLSGSNFHSIEHLYAEKWNTDLNKYGSKAARKSLRADLMKIRDDAAFRQKFLDKAKADFERKNNNRLLSSVDGELTDNVKKWTRENTYIQEIERIKTEWTKAQRSFFRIYGVSLNSDVLKNSSVFEDRKTLNTILWEPSHRLRIVDDGNRLSSRFDSRDKIKTEAAVHLMLEVAAAKGWELEEVVFFGDELFIANANRIRNERLKEQRLGVNVVRSLPTTEGKVIKLKTIPAPKEPTKITHPPHSKESQKRTKDQFSRLKRDVDSSLIVNALAKEGKVVKRVTTNSQRHTIFEVDGRRYNSIDALTKLTNRTLADAISYIEKGKSNSPAPAYNTKPQEEKTSSLKFT